MVLSFPTMWHFFTTVEEIWKYLIVTGHRHRWYCARISIIIPLSLCA